MSIKDWPANDRPRERLCRLGAEAVSDAELLGILLGTGDSRKGLTAVDCARIVLKRYTSLRGLASVPLTEFCTLPGVGAGKAARIHAALEIGRRVAGEAKREGAVFRGSRDVFAAYSVRLRDVPQEMFTVVLVDSKNRWAREKTVSVGSLNQSIVHPREVFRFAIREAAASVILVHNHPSGDPTPSPEDVRLTERLVEAGRLLGIRVLDHVIVGEGRYYSFSDEGRIPGATVRS